MKMTELDASCPFCGEVTEPKPAPHAVWGDRQAAIGAWCETCGVHLKFILYLHEGGVFKHPRYEWVLRDIEPIRAIATAKKAEAQYKLAALQKELGEK